MIHKIKKNETTTKNLNCKNGMPTMNQVCKTFKWIRSKQKIDSSVSLMVLKEVGKQRLFFDSNTWSVQIKMYQSIRTGPDPKKSSVLEHDAAGGTHRGCTPARGWRSRTAGSGQTALAWAGRHPPGAAEPHVPSGPPRHTAPGPAGSAAPMSGSARGKPRAGWRRCLSSLSSLRTLGSSPEGAGRILIQ